MAQKRKQYSKQFKVDAVKLIIEQGYKISEAAKSFVPVLVQFDDNAHGCGI
jgi:transposase-like protein